MKRREFIVALGGAAAWPVVARAQQPVMPVVGFLASSSAEAPAGPVAGIYANNQIDRLPILATELVVSCCGHRNLRRPRGCAGGEGCDNNDPDRVRAGAGSSPQRPSGEPQPARRQRHRDRCVHH